ncbi:MAG: ferrochelatase [Elusimicrobia bacterium RIFCSPLOWO2_12_FULL_59_9]|nr:MAG: ferrochelatase [Elusimicrobia bacterium RIFCSPLOWO2_12_FULL_59_9]
MNIPPPAKWGVLLMAYGAVDSLDDLKDYLTDIRGGREPSPELVAEIRERYLMMGGKSPLLDITRSQASALEFRLSQALGEPCPVFIGMRHWRPTIGAAVEEIHRRGIDEVVGLCLTPYESRLSVGAYFQKLEEAKKSAGAPLRTWTIASWNKHPKLISAFAQNLQKALGRFAAPERPEVHVLFTAHSLPERILKEGDPYPRQLEETVRRVVDAAKIESWSFAYQSRGRTPEPWLGPDAADSIETLARKGVKKILVAPIGFISDHMETLYDDDILYRARAEALGMRMERAPSLNDAPLLIEAMVETILGRKVVE